MASFINQFENVYDTDDQLLINSSFYKPLKYIVATLMFVVVGVATSGSVFAAMNVLPGILGVSFPTWISPLTSILFASGALYWGLAYAMDAANAVTQLFIDTDLKELNDTLINDYKEIAFLSDGKNETDVLQNLLAVLKARSNYYNERADREDNASLTHRANILNAQVELITERLQMHANNQASPNEPTTTTTSFVNGRNVTHFDANIEATLGKPTQDAYTKHMINYYLIKNHAHENENNSSPFSSWVINTSKVFMFLIMVFGIANAFLVNTFGLSSGALNTMSFFFGALSHSTILTVTIIASLSGIIAALALTMNSANRGAKILSLSWINAQTHNIDIEVTNPNDVTQTITVNYATSYAEWQEARNQKLNAPWYDSTSVALTSAFLFACAVCGFNFLTNLAAGHILFENWALLYQFSFVESFVGNNISLLSSFAANLGLLGGVVTFVMVLLMMSEPVLNKRIPSSNQPVSHGIKPSSILRTLAIVANFITLATFTLNSGSIWGVLGAGFGVRLAIVAAFSVPLVFLTNRFFLNFDDTIDSGLSAVKDGIQQMISWGYQQLYGDMNHTKLNEETQDTPVKAKGISTPEKPINAPEDDVIHLVPSILEKIQATQ